MASWKIPAATVATLALGALLLAFFWPEAPDGARESAALPAPTSPAAPLVLASPPLTSGKHGAPTAKPEDAAPRARPTSSKAMTSPRSPDLGPAMDPEGASAPVSDGSGEAAATPADDSNGAVIQTIVVLGADKKPVADALVSIRLERGPLLRRRRTDSSGAFSISPDECKGSNWVPRRVWIRHARWGRQGPFTIAPQDRTPSITLTKTRTDKVSGRILSTTGKVPFSPTIVVKVMFLTTKFGPEDFTAWNPSTGAYEIEVVPADRFTGKANGHFLYTSPYELRARAAGFCDSDVLRLERIGVNEVHDLVLEPECVVRGQVTLPVGIENDPKFVDPNVASFEIEQELPSGPRTEARFVRFGDGHTFQLAEMHPGWYRIRASVARMVGAWGTVQLVDGQTVESFTLHLDPAGWNTPTVEVRGKVVDKDGVPIPGCVIVTDGGRAETIEDGTFVFRLTPGLHELKPAADGFAPPYGAREINVAADKPPTPLKIVLESLDGQADE